MSDKDIQRCNRRGKNMLGLSKNGTSEEKKSPVQINYMTKVENRLHVQDVVCGKCNKTSGILRSGCVQPKS